MTGAGCLLLFQQPVLRRAEANPFCTLPGLVMITFGVIVQHPQQSISLFALTAAVLFTQLQNRPAVPLFHGWKQPTVSAHFKV